jgi:hypothetical protein
MIAAEIAKTPGSEITLLPGGVGKWEESKRDVFGHVEYKYFCRGVFRASPVYVEKQSPACGLWN